MTIIPELRILLDTLSYLWVFVLRVFATESFHCILCIVLMTKIEHKFVQYSNMLANY